MTERAPWEAEIPLARIAEAPFSKLVLSGAWDKAPQSARQIAGTALRAVCDVLEERLRAKRTIFRGAAHNPQLLGTPFNNELREFLAAEY